MVLREGIAKNRKMIFLRFYHPQQYIIEQHWRVLIDTLGSIDLTLTEETLKLSIGNYPGGCPERGAHFSVNTVFAGSLHAAHHEDGETIDFIEFMIAHWTAQVLVFRLRLHILFVLNFIYKRYIILYYHCYSVICT